MITDEIMAAYHRGKGSLILRGLLGITLGVVIIARPQASVAGFALVIAIWALIDGIANIIRAFDLRPVVPHWWVLLLAGVVSAAFGVAAFYYYPDLSLAFAVAWVGWWLITAGVLGVYAAGLEKKMGISWGWTMTFGIIALGTGVLAFVYPGVTLAALMGLIAAFGILSGIVMLIGAVKMQSFEHNLKEAVRTPSRA
jgi:uncharacterized membrane protein HdeD (DUF308 family)